jgi:hypothetical protein
VVPGNSGKERVVSDRQRRVSDSFRAGYYGFSYRAVNSPYYPF